MGGSVKTWRSSAATAGHQARRTIRRIWRHPSNRGRRLRRLAYASAFQAYGRVTRQPLKIRVGARSRMLAYLHFSATSEVVYANPPSIELRVWSRYLQPGDTFIDIGASVGVYTIFAIEQGASVVAFEPNAEAAALFRENMRLNDYSPEFHEAALSDHQGMMEMTSDLDVANHLVFVPDERSETSHAVATMTLDQVIGDRQVAGVKVDTEGTERLVLMGGGSALAHKRIRLLQLEWNYASMKVLGETRQPIVEMLASAGYRLLRPNAAGELVYPVTSFEFGRDVFAVPD